MGSYGGFGAGGYGRPIGPNGEMGQPTLTQAMESGTAATFQILESIVGAFGGFAQMLESTFMATHSSFFAMIGVAEQFGHLRNYLGQVLSIFTLLRWVKGLIARLTGREMAEDLSPESFKAFEAGIGSAENRQSKPGPRPSKKPIIIFLLAVFGVPYLMNRLVRLITAHQEEEARRRTLNGEPLRGPDGQLLPVQPETVDPSSLTFVRATHPYASGDPMELSFGVNDIIAVLTPFAEREEPGWWRGRLRDGRQGFFPSTHVVELQGIGGNKTTDEKPVKAVPQPPPSVPALEVIAP
jgi:peroxin-13